MEKAGDARLRSSPQALCLRGEADGDRYELVLRRGRTSIGSLLDNDGVLAVAGVSRHHAHVDWDNDGIWVEDLGSKNGTLVNGARVHRVSLRLGDAVCFGPVALLLEPMDVDDAVPAIEIPAGPEDTAKTTRRPSQRTPTERNDLAPSAWLGALARIGELTAAHGGEALTVALDVVRTATGARAVVLLSLVDGELIVTATAGDADIGAAFDPAMEALTATLDQQGDGRDHAVVRLGGDPPALVAIRAAGNGLAAGILLAQGDAPAVATCGPFLAAALRLIGCRDGTTVLHAAPALRRPVPELRYPPEHVPGRTPAMLGLYHQLHHLVAGDLPLLITGETGVGKEHVARIVHLSSERSAGPFVAVNCAAIPTDLLEAELFGIEKGVATGVEARDGKMQLARGGVIFLDEVGDMSPALQAKLLRALQEREVHPVGARRPVPLDVRILSATNTDLAERIVEGRFRQDLYFRLAGYTLHVPALRDRRGDISALVEHFMKRHSTAIAKRLRGISRKALAVLVDAPWPGNVRELESEVRRTVYLCHDGDLVTSALLSPTLQELSQTRVGGPPADDSLDLAAHTEALQRRLVTAALERAGGKVAAAARLLGLSRYGLTLMIRRLGIHAADQ